MAPARSIDLTLAGDDVIPTGNDWIALPSIRASDGALENFNVISMRYRGLLEVAGLADRPLMAPFVEIAGVRRPLAHLQWSLRDYWIPDRDDGSRRRSRAPHLCRPARSRAAIMRFQVTNLRAPRCESRREWMSTGAGPTASLIRRSRLSGRRAMSPTPIDTDMEVFKYNTDDTQMAWGFAYVGSTGRSRTGTDNPGLTARHDAELAPGQTLDMHFLIGAGLEEYSAAYAMRVLNKRIDRYGLDGVIDQAADDAHRRTRTTGDPDLDRIMNRNLLFSTYFAWGRAIDTEQFVGMTSRSNRYYVSAAYWDRDALAVELSGDPRQRPGASARDPRLCARHPGTQRRHPQPLHRRRGARGRVRARRAGGADRRARLLYRQDARPGDARAPSLRRR